MLDASELECTPTQSRNQRIRRRRSPSSESDCDKRTEPDVKPKSPPAGKLRRSNAVSNLAPSQSDYKPDEAEQESASGADWEMVDETVTPKSKKKAKPLKPKTRDLINECKAQDHDSEDMVVSTNFFVNLNS